MNLHERVLEQLRRVKNDKDPLHWLLWDFVQGHHHDEQFNCLICPEPDNKPYCLIVRRVALTLGITDYERDNGR